MKHAGLIFLVLSILLACSKGDSSPEPMESKDPTAVRLEFPLRNSECTEGLDQGAGITSVEFRWAEDENDSYVLVLENLITNEVRRSTTGSNSYKLTWK